MPWWKLGQRKVIQVGSFSRRTVNERHFTAEIDGNDAKQLEVGVALAWRVGYDRERDKALAEGRGCGKCIEGVVWFGQRPQDQAPCRLDRVDCKFTKQLEETKKID